jgi:hypothetical protein
MWEDNIKTDLVKAVRDGVKRIHLAQDKVLWRAPANTVMNSRIHWTQIKTSCVQRAEPSIHLLTDKNPVRRNAVCIKYTSANRQCLKEFSYKESE